MDSGCGTWTVAGDSQSHGQVKSNKNKKTQESLSMADGGRPGLGGGNSPGGHGLDTSDKGKRLP
ncbi:hypothetical protein BT93_L1026 [Corymbia citriodora subsp. variegata]|uniref:Uncharacterized protein n=1 Tax=Corymbia citriodora subsp. variegata TaxID=360336 RepID=A0A8T0CR86_CORYI|nr:hypothetical protein BT93_L1026 [Corymbia citriodora subsp. variegata]